MSILRLLYPSAGHNYAYVNIILKLAARPPGEPYGPSP